MKSKGIFGAAVGFNNKQINREEWVTIENRLIFRIVRIVLGWIFIFLGLIGIFLPLLQGLLFLVIGLMLLSSRYAFAQKLLHKAERRYPDEYARMQEVKDRLRTSKPLIATGVVVLVGLCALGIYLAVSAILRVKAGL